MPMDVLRRDPAARVEQIKQSEASPDGQDQPCCVVVVCRRGNDSQTAVQLLQEIDANLNIRDIRGGLHAWATDIDPQFPVY